MEQIEKLIEKIESETLAFYSAEEVIEILEDLKHSIFNNNLEKLRIKTKVVIS